MTSYLQIALISKRIELLGRDWTQMKDFLKLFPDLTNFFIYISEWLKEGDDVPLKVTAALSMGNLCCSSQNCQELIGVFCPVLIQALKDHQAPLVRYT